VALVDKASGVRLSWGLSGAERPSRLRVVAQKLDLPNEVTPTMVCWSETNSGPPESP
jgi:hypothetical protein